MEKNITAFNTEATEKKPESTEMFVARLLPFSVYSVPLCSLCRKSLSVLSILLACPLQAGAVQVQGGKPLTHANDALRGEQVAAAEVVMLHGVVDMLEVDVGVVTINGLRLSMAGVPLHGPAGNLNLRDLLPGSRVRIALGGPPNQRRLLELWLLGPVTK